MTSRSSDSYAIAAIGDSHSLRCFENHEHIADSTAITGVNKLDGKTAYKLPDHDRRVRKVLAPVADKHLIFSFGEVDVRLHIRYQEERTGISAATLLQRTAERYTDYVAELRLQGFDIHIFNVVPTGEFHGPQFEKWKSGLTYPFTTSYRERQQYTLELNRLYRYCCHRKNIPFVDIYHLLIDKDGNRKRELVYDFSHLNATTGDILLQNYSFTSIAHGPSNTSNAEGKHNVNQTSLTHDDRINATSCNFQ